jgi:hypothetical protein
MTLSIRKDYEGPPTTLKGSSGSVLFIQFIWQRKKFFATPQHQSIRMFWIFTQARERRNKNGKTRESEKKGPIPFFPTLFLPSLTTQWKGPQNCQCFGIVVAPKVGYGPSKMATWNHSILTKGGERNKKSPSSRKF